MFTNILQSFSRLLDKKWSRYHRFTLLVAVTTIFYLATTSVDYKVQSSFNDKFNHLFAFGSLSFLSHIAFQTFQPIRWATALLGYGALIECVQFFLPYRSFSLLDLAADLTGIVLYIIVFYPLFNRLLSSPASYYAKS
ncbi:VanZ family protein [Alkalimarinus coralli]|uniref:VanZ family protein n=1 Tax=Alkalimarinus coralli TaxID=2935863 RepID=UPI00202B3DDC|nr:VanZ family protein [Alkalimarinus coralli]